MLHLHEMAILNCWSAFNHDCHLIEWRDAQKIVECVCGMLGVFSNMDYQVDQQTESGRPLLIVNGTIQKAYSMNVMESG